MREILFRGKNDNGEWVYGWLGHPHCYNTSTKTISSVYFTEIYDDLKSRMNTIVDYKSVGQFTGLTDKNGKKIFEGDIIKSDNGKQSAVSVCKFGEYHPKMFYIMLDMFSPGRKHLPAIGFYAESVDKGEEMILFQSPCVTVIGNIHDNPELLEG